jgi:hypothetical protein
VKAEQRARDAAFLKLTIVLPIVLPILVGLVEEERKDLS